MGSFGPTSAQPPEVPCPKKLDLIRCSSLMQCAKYAQPQNISIQTQSSIFDKCLSLSIDGLFEI
jgi:hypothetical protein